jgi:hypothetical protein
MFSRFGISVSLPTCGHLHAHVQQHACCCWLHCEHAGAARTMCLALLTLQTMRSADAAHSFHLPAAQLPASDAGDRCPEALRCCADVWHVGHQHSTVSAQACRPSCKHKGFMSLMCALYTAAVPRFLEEARSWGLDRDATVLLQKSPTLLQVRFARVVRSPCQAAGGSYR